MPFSYLGLLSAQTNSFCGAYQAIPPNGSNPDSLIYDRFGNIFDFEDLTVPPQPSITSVCNSSYFNVEWVGNPSQNVQDVVCEVLGYVASVIQQRQGLNNCGALPSSSVEIQVGWISFSNPDIDVINQLGMSPSQFPLSPALAGIGSPFYNPLGTDNACNEIILERAFIKINGGKTPGGNTIFDGRLLLNSDVSWNYNTTATTFSGVDMFTVTLHEMMHIMGFGSVMGSIGAFSLWDKLLRVIDNYQPTGGSQNPAKVIESATSCGRNCWETAISGFGNIAINSCVGSGQDVVVDDDAIAPIAGNPSVDPNNLNAFANMLSHLSMTCNGQNQPYVMRPVLNSGEFQRTITAPEQQIFCRLGYLVPSISCDGCYVIAQQDAQMQSNEECCFKLFYVCVGESFEILNEELLCNDLSNDNQITVTDLWHQPVIGSPLISIVPNSSGTGWIVTVPPNVSQFLNASLNYTLSGCDCRQSNGRVRLFIDHYCPTSPFSTELCDNLLRDGDFEDAIDNSSNPNNEPVAMGGWPIIFQGNPLPATPDMHKTNAGNHYLGLVNLQNTFTDQEAINLELQKCIKPGCELTLSMDLSSQILIGTTLPALQVWGSQNRSCSALSAPPASIAFNCGVQTICLPDIFDPICVFNGIPVSGTWTDDDNPNFVNSGQLTWTNQTNQEVCFLTFVNPASSPTSSKIFLDNIVAEIRCESEIACNSPVPVEICEGEAAANISFQICATKVAEYLNFSTVTPTVTLPSGWTVIGGNPAPVTLTTGQCANINLQVQIPPGTPSGTIATVELSGTVTGLCTETGWSCESEIMVINCGANFVCPCTGSGALNINAGDPPIDPNQNTTGISVVNTPLSGSQPLQNSYNNIGKCIAIKGNLLIDNNFTLSIDGGEIRMQPGAKIIVKNGATLNMKGINGGSSSDPTQKGIHGCEQMWRSIVVEAGGKLGLSGNIIQDAEYAVDVKGGSNMPSLVAANNDFDRNHVGIRINGAVIQPYPFQQNKFRATSALLPVYSSGITNWTALRSYTGMDLSSTTFTVGVAGNITSENLFTGPGLRNGILAGGSYVNVYHAKFTQLWGGVSYNQPSPAPPNSHGVGIYGRSGGKITVHNSTFGGEGLNSWRAIYVGRCNLEAKLNDMYDISNGVFASPAGQATEITIDDNDFRVTLPGWGSGQAAYVINNLSPGTNIKILNNDPIQIKGNGPAILLANDPNNAGTTTRRISGNYIYHSQRFYEGIRADNCSNWTIDNNHIFYSGFPTGDVFWQITRGIFLSNSDNCFLQDNEIRATDGSLIGTTMRGIELLGSQNCTLCCNLTDATTVGNFFMANCDPTNLRHAQMYNHWVGLDCRDIGSVIGDQEWGGNEWLGAYGMLGAWHTGSQANIEGSEFFIEGPQTATYWPPSREPDDADIWFREFPGSSNDCTTADARCPNLPIAMAPNEPRALTENERRIANGTYASTHIYDQITQREGERRLYREMKINASLSGQDTLVDQLFASMSTSAAGQLYDVESHLQTLGTLPENDRTRLLQILHDMDSLAQVRNQTDLLYTGAQNAADSATLYDRKVACFNAARSLLEEWLEIRDDAEIDLHTQIPDIITMNNSIVSSDIWTTNRKTVNRIYLETIASGIDTATQQQIEDLLAVANQCALEGGDAVMQARAIYCVLAEVPLMLDDMEICDLGIGERSDKITPGQIPTVHRKVNVIPNPARNAFVLTVEGVNPGAMLRLQVLSANGVLEKEMMVANGTAILSSFNPGLYFCRVYVGEEPAEVVKLVIIP